MTEQYSFDGGALVLKPDSTFLILGVGTIVKGTIEFGNSYVTLVPYKPKSPFVLYGRSTNDINTGNKLMFQGFDESETLINYEQDNYSLKTMKRVYNVDANCVDYPNILNNTTSNKKFYFALKGTDNVYEFHNNKGYNDFIVLHLPQYEESEMPALTFRYKNKKLFYNGEALKKEELLSDEEISHMLGMYERVFSESENYYCNPSYNVFEEKGIDLRNYKKTTNGEEYFFTDKYNEIDNELDYHNTSIIYEYKKINPIILTNPSYTLEKGSVFHFKCGTD